METHATQNKSAQLEAAETRQPTLQQSRQIPMVMQEQPKRFGRYRIEKKLGQGAMGSVYLAQDELLNRQVALKIPQLTADIDPETLRRFCREARAAAMIQHPNICPVYDMGEINGIPFLTMAYIEGKTLATLVAKGRPLPHSQALKIVRKVALAMAVAHRRGVIHRDLKPSNIMMDPRQEPVIMDFGLARILSGHCTRLTLPGQMMGTPAYMPPEQVLGDVDAIGPRCDIYSLGAVLFQLCTGQLPFDGSIYSILHQIVHVELVPPS